MPKIAFLFPGQGSQVVGMGQDFYKDDDSVRELFDMAEEECRINLSRLCFKGPMEELTATINLQPALTVVNLACQMMIERAGISAHYTAGHSLGEYSALCHADVLSARETIAIVNQRGRLMHREALKHKGAMQAIVGLEIGQVEEILSSLAVPGEVAIANHNAKTQIVITGSPKAVTDAAGKARAAGARAIPLKVSGAWHSNLMAGAKDEFGDYLASSRFKKACCAVILNVTAQPTIAADEIKAVMSRQLCSPVRWYECMQKLIEAEVELFVEVGPGKVLSGLLRKIVPKEQNVQIMNVSSLRTLDTLVNQMA